VGSISLNDIAFLGGFGLVVLAIAAFPFLFLRYVRRERWYWLPLTFGVLNGIFSFVLYYGALVGLIGGPIYFGLALGILAYRKKLPPKAIPVALVVEIVVMSSVFVGICYAIF